MTTNLLSIQSENFKKASFLITKGRRFAYVFIMYVAIMLLTIPGKAQQTIDRLSVGRQFGQINWQGIRHSSLSNNVGNYALIQDNTGRHTLINKSNTGNGYIGFRVGNSNKMVILNNGNVGIGTSNPSSHLHILNPYAVINLTPTQQEGGGSIQLSPNEFLIGAWSGRALKLWGTGGVKVQSLEGNGTRMVVAGADGRLSTQAIPSGGGSTGPITVNTNVTDMGRFTTSSNDGYLRVISTNNNAGNAGIELKKGNISWLIRSDKSSGRLVFERWGVGAPLVLQDHKVMAKELVVCASPDSCPDYVFEEDYPLMSLPEIQDFITANKHLPHVPSASDVAIEEGMDVKKTVYGTLENVEVLTLHTIRQQEEIDALKQQLEALLMEIAQLRKE